MCTDTANIKPRRFAQIAALGETLFHSGDLAKLWDIQNPDTLHTTLSRYVKQGLLQRVYKGLYSIKALDTIHPWLLGLKALHEYAYVSTETILYTAGVINQKPGCITLVSGKSMRFRVRSVSYYSRRMSDAFLYNPAGVEVKEGIRRASTERAVADLLYYNPGMYIDNPGLYDQDKLVELQKNIGHLRSHERDTGPILG
jgi:predicted transcriptional regulator of viral defense system